MKYQLWEHVPKKFIFGLSVGDGNYQGHSDTQNIIEYDSEIKYL